MVHGLTLIFDEREHAQQCLRVMKKSGTTAKLSVDPTLISEEMVFGTINQLRACVDAASPEDDEDDEALMLASGILNHEEEAFSRIISAVEEDGGRSLCLSGDAPLSEEDEAAHLEDAARLIVYEAKGLIKAEEGVISLQKSIEPGDLEVAVPAPLLLFPSHEDLVEANLTAERIVSSEMVYSVSTGIDIIFCDDPSELIGLLEECQPEEESFVAFLEQFFLFLTLAEEVVSAIQQGAASVSEVAGTLPSKLISLDEEVYPIRFSLDEEMVSHMVDALRSAGKIAGKDGRLKVR
ncbi:MAG: hypothetical protein Q7J09_05585 [Methanocalculus sp.]|uniref:hypothetical protein n=1 Tax=Methanocalculus sp. TaxID=2004547 RepID=UPI002727FD47|nr:hypothetical protein [Methanocalculus sp.]MDO8840861.1 hypothetical protein [Methanocalculus sp.]MDO9539458.1 hypothetical protein [Methanocalculus sp.]